MYCACGHPSPRYGQNSYAPIEVENINLMKFWDILLTAVFPKPIDSRRTQKQNANATYVPEIWIVFSEAAGGHGRREEVTKGGKSIRRQHADTDRQTFTAQFRRRRTDRQLFQVGFCCIKFLQNNDEHQKANSLNPESHNNCSNKKRIRQTRIHKTTVQKNI